MRYSPAAAIITNIDREHLDIYKNLNEIKKVFLKFINNIQSGGILVVNKDDKNLFGLKNQIQKIGEKKNLKVFWYSISPRRFGLNQRMSEVLKIPAEHNLSNALATYTLAKALGIFAKDDIFNAVSDYRGAWRRMEFRGSFKVSKFKSLKVNIYDDYAHHPTEIKATLAGIAQKWPKTAIICVFQPHQAQRLSALFKEFIGAFDNADVLIILDIFKVKGRDEISQSVNSQKLAEAVEKHTLRLKPKTLNLKTVVYLPRHEKLPDVLKKIIQTQFLKPKIHNLKPIVIMMGAGDVYKLTDKLIQ